TAAAACSIFPFLWIPLRAIARAVPREAAWRTERRAYDNDDSDGPGRGGRLSDPAVPEGGPGEQRGCLSGIPTRKGRPGPGGHAQPGPGGLGLGASRYGWDRLPQKLA